MKRQIWKLAATAAASAGLVLLTGCSGGGTPNGAQPAASTPSSVQAGSSTENLKTAASSLGTIIVNGQGMTAYVFDHDSANSGVSTCTGACLSLWPAITSTTATPIVTGISGTVATITGSDGAKQVTINGLPLYTYTPDTKPGDDSGQGYGGIWWVVGPNGHKIVVQSTPAVQSTPTGNSGSGY